MTSRTLAEIVVQEGILDAIRLQAAERNAVRAGEPLIVTLVEKEHAPELIVARALARHLHLSLVDDGGEPVRPDADALREVARDVAARRRLVPLSLEVPVSGPRRLKLLMADPTDRDAVAEVELSTGCRVEPALATLSFVDAELARAYRGQVTEVIPRPRIDAQATPAPVKASGGTQPHHRLEDEATLEMRHRALLALLRRKGLVTDEEYAEEIRRLLRDGE